MSNVYPENEPRQQRLVPPEDLPAPHVPISNEVVHAAPEWHLLPHHMDLLRRYCHAVWLHRQFLAHEAQVVSEGGLAGLFAINGTDTDDLRYYLAKKSERVGAEVQSLAAALKLNPLRTEKKPSREPNAKLSSDSDPDGLLYVETAH